MMNWINKKRNKKGFTLVELVVVIAILGILAAVAVPRLAASRDAAQTSANQATARTIISAVTIAEATYGTGFTLAQVNEFLDNDVVANTDTTAKNKDVWSVDIAASPIVVYKGNATSAVPVPLP